MISPDREAIERAFDRVRVFPNFRPADRIWWLYLREAEQRWLEPNEHAGIPVAHDGVKAFPENLPDELTRWLALRSEIEHLIRSEIASLGTAQP
jgi:hypothetical protein